MELTPAIFTHAKIEADIDQRMAEYYARADARRRADLAALPIASGVLVVREYVPFRRYKGSWWCLEVNHCPHCGRSHCTTITGATRPRRAKLESARAGEHVGRCPYNSWAPYRVAAIIEGAPEPARKRARQ